MNKIYGII